MFDRLTRDEPRGRSKNVFDTKWYILGPALGNSQRSLRSFATSAKETDVFTSQSFI